MNVNNIEKICNICGDTCVNETVLKCNPNHVFCYQCIYDWYIVLLKNNYSHEYKKRMCPICKKDGGYLTYNILYVFNNTIHKKQVIICNTPLKSNKNKLCNKTGTYDGKCFLHKNVNTVNSIGINTVNSTGINTANSTGINTANSTGISTVNSSEIDIADPIFIPYKAYYMSNLTANIDNSNTISNINGNIVANIDNSNTISNINGNIIANISNHYSNYYNPYAYYGNQYINLQKSSNNNYNGNISYISNDKCYIYPNTYISNSYISNSYISNIVDNKIKYTSQMSIILNELESNNINNKINDIINIVDKNSNYLLNDEYLFIKEQCNNILNILEKEKKIRLFIQ